MIADVNDGQVYKAAECDDVLMNIRTEALVMGQSKEVLMMLFDEEFARMDYATDIAISREEGKATGVNNFAALVNKLFALNRSDDIKRAANDKEYCAALFKEFNIV